MLRLDSSIFPRWVARVGLATSALALSTGCDPEPEDATYLAVGSDVQQQDLELGSYRSTNPAVLPLLEMKATSGSGCSGITLTGCPGSEITIHRTLVTFQAVAPGEAAIVGKSNDGQEVSLDFKVEEVTAVQVRRVVDPSDNNSAQVEMASNEELSLHAGASEVLQIYLLGKSQAPLGYLAAFDVVSEDESILSVQHGVSSYGYRASLKAVTQGTTSVVISTPELTRTLAIRVEPSN